VTKRLQFRLADIDLQRLREMEAEVAPAHTEILRRELQKFWLQQLQTFPHPVRIVVDGETINNSAALVFDALKDNTYSDQSVVGYERQIELQKTQIDILTEKLNELMKQHPAVPAQEEEVKETSLLLTLWKNFSAKPGAFGFSIDLKALITESIEILRDRSRLTELGLNKPRS
jgi:hypothetical protein